MSPVDFQHFGFDPRLLSALAARGITVPTPIQEAAIPVGMEGKDLLGIAQTGTGKTLAYGLPLLHRLVTGGGRALILVPTRELAHQVDEALAPAKLAVGIQSAVFIGGASMHLQRQMLKRNPRILIATPGRLIDHLERKTVTLREVSILVLDEADRMLDMGFAPQLKKILQAVPTERQTLLFSATMPQAIFSLATRYMRMPIRLEIAPAGTAAEHVEQAVLVLHKEDKPLVLQKLFGDFPGTVLVFVRTKHGAKKLTKALLTAGHNVAEIHSNRSLSQRREALAGFKSGRFRILVATDIAARGIDVQDIALVVNYDLPDNPEEYVHRIGRTGRAGKAGQAISLATTDQRADIRTIERLIRTTLPVSELPSVHRHTVAAHSSSREAMHHRPHHRHSFGAHRRGRRGRR